VNRNLERKFEQLTYHWFRFIKELQFTINNLRLIINDLRLTKKNMARTIPVREEGMNEEHEDFKVKDKRRFNADGELIFNEAQTEEKSEPKTEPQKSDYVKQLEAAREAADKKLVEVQARFDELKSRLEREAAETRQRLNKTADEKLKREKAEFIATLLPVLDNLHRAIEAGQTGTLESLLDGVRGTANGFENALLTVGVEPVTSIGATFNPELHEAVDTKEVEADKDNTITAEYSRGYKLGDRLLRPARVQVGHAKT
jgi:molecular chaperone GrpE